MITRRELHTYRDEFPLILISPDGHQVRLSHDLDWIFRSQILNLSDFSSALPLTYIARHTDDKIPDAILEEFRSRSPSFGSVPEGWTLGVPTVWFVCYSDDESKTTSVIKGLAARGIRHFPKEPEFHDSFDSIPPDGCYTLTGKDASIFPKFLHQVTQIGLDLLKSPDQGGFLREYKLLEYWETSDAIQIESLFEKLKAELQTRSIYYRTHIATTAYKCDEFWSNFGRINGMYSWPHFLFNICGA